MGLVLTIWKKEGIKYEGEFKEDNMEGYGIMTFNNVLSKYEGEFKKNKMNGYGIFYLDINDENKIQKGFWKNGELINEIK